jgi:hypothetical protein
MDRRCQTRMRARTRLPDQHFLRGAREPLDENVDASLHADDECLSNKLENQAASVAIYFTWYNFGRVRQALKTTPAVKAGIASRPWTVEEMIELLTKDERKSTRAAISNSHYRFFLACLARNYSVACEHAFSVD